MITQQELKEQLHYDPLTGAWTWIVSRPGILVGSKAGTKRKEGYIIIHLHRKLYRSSRLAFLYQTGRMPDGEIDHINRNTSDDRWENLREATRSQQEMNKLPAKNNTSGTRGVCWSKYHEKWMSRIKINKQWKHLGYFTDLQDAIVARKSAEKNLFKEFTPK